MYRHAILAVSICLAAMNSVAVSASEPEWLPISRSDLETLIAERTDIVEPEIQTFEDFTDAMRLEFASNQGKLRRLERNVSVLMQFQHPDDAIWSFREPSLGLTINMAGSGDRLHSLRLIWTPDLLDAEQAMAFEFLSAFFQAIYPGWPEAQHWAKKSLIDAWESHPFSSPEKAREDPDSRFIRTERGGIMSSTIGMPPDIVFYHVTVRERCIPIIKNIDPCGL